MAKSVNIAVLYIVGDRRIVKRRFRQLFGGAKTLFYSSCNRRFVLRPAPHLAIWIAFLILSLFSTSIRAQSPYADPVSTNAQSAVPAGRGSLQVRYFIYAAWHQRDDQKRGGDGLHQLDVMERIQLFNQGNQPLTKFVVSLYPNRYSSDSTTLADSLLRAGDLRLYFARPNELGQMTGLDFSALDGRGVAGKAGLQVTDLTVGGTQERLLVTLSSPLLPGDSLVIQSPFTLTLPARLIDLGYQQGVNYLKDWFIQITDPKSAPQKATASVQLTLPGGSALWVNESRLEPGGPDAEPGAHQDEHYAFTMDPHSMMVIVPESSSGVNTIDWQPLTGNAAGAHTPSRLFFDRLLPGPLAAKRPVRPDSVWAQMLGARSGQYPAVKKTVKPAFLGNVREADLYRYISLSPAIGYNDYDQWMPGILIHNYGLPVRPFNFLLAPLYSTADHTLSGLGALSYTVRHPFDKWQLNLTGSSYGFNAYSDFSDGAGGIVPGADMRLIRIVPAIRYKWLPDHENPDKSWSLSAKAYILNKDTWVATDDQLTVKKTTTTIGEVSAEFNDSRALYPYRLSAGLQGTDQFLRLAVEGRYFLNYNAKGAGLAIRGYGGKFFYLVEKNIQSTYNLTNYFFNLSGSTGQEDFAFNDYFIGRNAYRGWMSQQMTTGGGFFKVSTPYSSEPVGQTDDWLAAINLTSDLPDGINPFSVLPFRLPVRVFMDLGTYSNLWSENPAAGRFLYDAGLQVSVLKEAVTVYFPVLYSKIYRDTYKSMDDMGKFAQRIRFSIDLGRLLPKGLHQDLKW